MHRNRLILACAAILSFGMWIAWRSISRVDAKSPAEDLVLPRPSPEEPPRPDATLDRAVQEVASSRAPAIVEPKADTELPVLVAGIVVDAHDAPVEAASLSVGHHEEISISTPGGARISRSDVSGRFEISRSDASGRFEVRGFEESLHPYVIASKEGVFSVQVPFERGATQVKIVLRRGGVVAGRVLVDPEIPIRQLRVRLEESDDALGAKPIDPRGQHSSSATDRLTRDLSEDGSFTFEGLEAMTVNLTFYLDTGIGLAAVRSIRVREIGEAGDPRLDPLDLRGALKVLAIDVLDDTGRKCSGATVVLADPQGRVGDRRAMTQDGRATFLTPVGVYDVDVDRIGWRRVHLTGVESDQVVQLRKGAPVRAILDGSGDLPAPPYRLVVALLADVQQPRPVVDGMGTFAAGRETTFLASSPGLHEVAWYLESGTRQTFLVGTPRRIVELRDSEEEQSIHLDLSSALRDCWEATERRLESEAERARADEEKPRATFPHPQASANERLLPR